MTLNKRMLARLGTALVLATIVSTTVQSQDLRFERLVPALQQPWYFADGVDGIVVLDGRLMATSEAVGYVMTRAGRVITTNRPFLASNSHGLTKKDGFVYMATFNGLVIFDEFFNNLAFLTSSGPGEISKATDVDFFNDGRFVVLDSIDNEVSVYDPGFEFLYAFGSSGSGPGQFNAPEGLYVDENDQIYVADSRNHRIQVFDSTGNQLREFGSLGIDPGELSSPQDLVMDPDGNLLIAQSSRIQVFNAAAGTYVSDFAPPASGSNFFTSLTFDTDGSLLVGSISAIHRFTPDYEFVSSIRGSGTEPGFVDEPRQLAVDFANDRIYVTDSRNNRVSVFDGDGESAGSWDSLGVFGPQSIVLFEPDLAAVGGFGVAITDRSGNVQSSFAVPSGTGQGELQFSNVGAIDTIDGSEFFITQLAFENGKVVVYDSNGQFDREWSINDLTNGDPLGTVDLAVDGQGEIAVLTRFNSAFSIIRYEADGTPINQFPVIDGGGISVNDDGNLLLAGSVNFMLSRIVEYDLDGNLIFSRDIPGGTGPGQVRDGVNYHVAEFGPEQMVLSDARNNRLQFFRRVFTTENPKAIVVSGGGPYPGNALWDATRANAKFAYRTLLSQGFDKDQIFYVSDDATADLDQNGMADDVDGPATGPTIQNAITGSFAADATELVVYLVDHGGVDAYRLSGSEILSSGDIAGWLDTWQTAAGGARLTFIYDACQAGSFVDEISTGSSNRIVITSARADQSAYFVSQGTLSFSTEFWTQIFNGETLRTAYDLASQRIEAAFPTQTPGLDADGNGITDEANDFAALDAQNGGTIGNRTIISGSRPTIGGVSASAPTGNTSTITALGVTDADGISRVWATFEPPGYTPGSSDNPIVDFPTIDMFRVPATDDYVLDYSGLNQVGEYQIRVYAEDFFGNISVAGLTTVTIDNPLRRRAVIIGGGDIDDVDFPSIRANADIAYAALIQQGYGPDGTDCTASSCDEIQYLISEAVLGFDSTPDLSNVQGAIETWGTDQVQDLTIYLTAPIAGNNYRLNGSETLSGAQLDAFLDTAESAIPGLLTVIIDSDRAGAFVDALSPVDNRRILISSTSATDLATNPLAGGLSFSRYFWTQILNGGTVRAAFTLARNGVRFADNCQNPELDDNGNLTPNELLDGVRSNNYRIGSGLLLAGDDPVINDASAPDIVTEGQSFNLTVTGITSTGTIDQVVAITSSSEGCETTTTLTNQGGGVWSGTVQDVTADSPPLQVAAFAVDSEGNVSLPVVRSVSGDFILRDGFE